MQVEQIVEKLLDAVRTEELRDLELRRIQNAYDRSPLKQSITLEQFKTGIIYFGIAEMEKLTNVSTRV